MTEDITPPVHWMRQSGKAHVWFLDQTRLPQEERWIDCYDVETLARAIETLQIRGAPALGVAAAYGLALAAWNSEELLPAKVAGDVRRAADRLRSTRPTAINLAWALERVLATGFDSLPTVEDIRQRLIEEAESILAEDIEMGRKMGQAGAALIPDDANIITHCHTGPLATGGYGTALGVVLAAHRAGKRVHVWVDETRPLLQGARLTCYDLARAGVPHTLITDSMAACLMALKKAALAAVGADRIAANGDVANKVGTYSLACLCRRHAVPFYVVAPSSTVDLSMPSGAHIPIEQRAADEVRTMRGTPVAPAGVPVFNPAFDVTPADLVTAIVTERGVHRPPYQDTLAAALARKR